jgi:hypothetical protein
MNGWTDRQMDVDGGSGAATTPAFTFSDAGKNWTFETEFFFLFTIKFL